MFQDGRQNNTESYIVVDSLFNAYDKFTLSQYFGQRPFSRKNMHFSINYIVSVSPF